MRGLIKLTDAKAVYRNMLKNTQISMGQEDDNKLKKILNESLKQSIDTSKVKLPLKMTCYLIASHVEALRIMAV